MEASTAEVRAWARTHGIEVNERGALSSDVYMAWELAHNGDDGDGGGLTVTIDDEVIAAASADPGPASPVNGDPPLEPAPDLDPDPDPRHPKRGAALRLAAAAKVTAAVRKDIKAKTALFLSVPATAFEQRDPVCGAVALEVVPDVAEALTDIFCDSPDVVAFFTSAGGGFMKWMQLAVAIQPLAQIAYAHHIARSIGQGGGPGQQPNGQGPGLQFVPADPGRFHAPAF